MSSFTTLLMRIVTLLIFLSVIDTLIMKPLRKFIYLQ